MTFITAEWAAAVRLRATAPEFADARRTLDAQVATYLAWLPDVPTQQAGYYHNFFCPEHAVQLVFDPHSPHRHACPVDGAIFTGEPFDSAWLWSVNDMLSDAALKLAFYAFLRDGSGARNKGRVATARRRARAILRTYARRYTTLPRAPGTQYIYPGHATWSGLDESVWIIRLTWAYALLGDTISQASRRLIRDALLQPATEHIRRVRRPDIHNIGNWNNAALATLALALGDQALLYEVVDGPLGLRAQLTHGVREDGFWFEGSLSYHYYALAGIVWMLRALRASGRPFDDDGSVRAMFQAPIALAFPDLTLPAIHDCWYGIGLTGLVGHGIPDAAGFYEVAYAWFGDPLAAWILRQNYPQRPRSSFEALLDGVPTIAESPAPSFKSCHAAASGLAVLRSRHPREEQTCLILKAGPAVASHGHPDQLSIQLFAHGERLSPDLGTPGYGIGMNDTWYRHTASHNTALIDGRSQPLTTGRIERFEADDNGLVEASVSWAEGDYAGVYMRRVILWRDLYFVDVFSVECPTPRQIDWLHHTRGELVTPLRGHPLPGELGDGAYAHVSSVCRSEQSRPVRLRWRLGRAGLDLHLNPHKHEEVYSGIGPANPASEKLSVIIRRQTGTRALFLAVFAPWAAGTEPYVRRVHWRRGREGSLELAVDTPQGTDRWQIPLRQGQGR